MHYCDTNPSILEWACTDIDTKSTAIAIPYHNPVKTIKNPDKEGINSHYYPDFYIKYKDNKGIIQEALVEVKMKIETKPPKQPKRKTSRFKKKILTYMMNEAKWKQAKKFCDKSGIQFKIITEEFIKNHANCI